MHPESLPIELLMQPRLLIESTLRMGDGRPVCAGTYLHSLQFENDDVILCC